MNLNYLKQYLLTPTCLKCGSFFCTETLFCKTCFTEELEPRINLIAGSHIEKNRHYYLIDWFKNDSIFIDQMVYRLKSDNSLAAWAFYVKTFHYLCRVDFKKYNGIIPVPSCKAASVHSRVFAQELSKLTGLPVFNILSKSDGFGEQKKATLDQRRKQKIQSVGTEKIEHFTKVIFVDDILTTGQSFLQSNQAINGGFQNIILTLFYRPKMH